MIRIPTTIFDSFERKFVPAVLIIGIDAVRIGKTGSQWKSKRLQHAIRGKDIEHWHWDWEQKASRFADLLAYEFFSLECYGEIQGLMLTESVNHRTELVPDRGKPILYVEYIESAPHNVTLLSDIPRYQGVGTRLMEMAARYSIKQGFDGRVGLLALPQAEQFYLKKGLTRVRKEAEVGLVYYEWTAEASGKFLGKGSRNDI